MTSRPLPASRRNPLTVIDPSGYASAAATAKRNGVSSPTSLRGGIRRELRTLVHTDCGVPRTITIEPKSDQPNSQNVRGNALRLDGSF
jgi:hypothetical protein